MRFALSVDDATARDAVRDLLAKECPPGVVRAAWDGDASPARDAWRLLAEMGVAGALVPDERGEAGLDEVGLVAVLEEVGAAAVPLPVVDTVAVAAPLAAGGPPGLLARLTSGSAVAACVPAGTDLVPYARVADLFVVLGTESVRLVEAADAVVEAVPSVDGSRRLGRVRLPDGAGVAIGAPPAHLRRASARAALGIAAEQVGLARRMLELTVRYVSDRKQFGVPVGSFQAVKHHIADAYLRLEFARPAVWAAAWALREGAPTADRDVAAAKVLATKAADLAARRSIQCHGAIGYTIEYDLHLFAKRAWALATTWGTAEQHLSTVAATIGLETGP